MKAAVINKFGDENVFEFAEVPVPEIKKSEVLVRVKAVSLNPIDYKQRLGNHKFILGSPFPIVLGYDVSGVVEKTGSNANRLTVGQEVFGRLDHKYGGALAEFAAASESVFTVKPANISHIEAASIPMAACTALQALRDKAKLKPTDKILIIGATGGVGSFAVQIANMMKAEVHAVASAIHKDFIKQLKPHAWIDYTERNFLELEDKFNVVFDVAGKTSYPKSKHLLQKGGCYITSLPRPKLLLHKPVARLRGKKVKTLLMKANYKDLDEIVKWMDEGKLETYIEHVFTFEDIAKAHKAIQGGHTEGKIVVEINPNGKS